MKRLICLISAIMLTGAWLGAQNLHYVDASSLTLVGKLMDTPNIWHRVDTVRYKGFTKAENLQVRCPAGVALAFKTDSPSIWVHPEYGEINRSEKTMGLAQVGFDLYIKNAGRWLYANSNVTAPGKDGQPLCVIDNMDKEEKECLLYLPIYSELRGLEVGVAKGSKIEAIENPFRNRIAIFGSSFTHGISTSRAGMSYPKQLERMTGIQFLSLGCSGNCKLQPYFADVLCDVQADAFVFDSFSNPTPELVRERLFPFIEKLQAAHPGVPLIFQQTIVRGRTHFNHKVKAMENGKKETAEELMAIACKKYKDVYFIYPDATDHVFYDESVDGTHPGDYGYHLWAESIRKPLLKIFAKYGIK